MTDQPSRAFPDLWVDPADDPRHTDDEWAGEREIVCGYLDHFRMTFELKCGGLDAAQLARRSVPPSTMSLLGLLRHLASVEHQWFKVVLDGQDLPRPFKSPEDRDLDFNGAVADAAVVAQAWEVWRENVAFARAWVAGADSFEVRGTMKDGSTLELREVLVHMIEEYARHCGHADLLRECVDGRTGQ